MAQGSNNYIEWNDVFMGMAVLTSKRSNDPSTKVGACISNNRNIIVGLGCNEICLETNYVYHAAHNAILYRYTSSVEGCTLYTTLFPCNECAKLIVQSGIKKVIYLSDVCPTNQEDINIAKHIFSKAGVDFRKFESERKSISIDYNCDYL